MNGMITLGIPGSVIQGLTSGLSVYVAPTEDQIPAPGSLPPETPTPILDEVTEAPVNSSIFATPARGIRITWQVVAESANVETTFYGSLDGVNFVEISDMTGPGVETLITGILFIQVSIDANPDLVPVTILVTCKRKRLV